MTFVCISLRTSPPGANQSSHAGKYEAEYVRLTTWWAVYVNCVMLFLDAGMSYSGGETIAPAVAQGLTHLLVTVVIMRTPQFKGWFTKGGSILVPCGSIVLLFFAVTCEMFILPDWYELRRNSETGNVSRILTHHPLDEIARMNIWAASFLVLPIAAIWSLTTYSIPRNVMNVTIGYAYHMILLRLIFPVVLNLRVCITGVVVMFLITTIGFFHLFASFVKWIWFDKTTAVEAKKDEEDVEQAPPVTEKRDPVCISLSV